MFGDWPLFGLFLSSFISSTLFPGGSEAVLAYLDAQQQYTPMLLLSIATGGNTLGGMTSWAVGVWLARKYPFVSEERPKHERAVRWLSKWGSPALFLSWLPIIGDPLCVVAGWLRISFFAALFWIALGKAVRYLMILELV